MSYSSGLTSITGNVTSVPTKHTLVWNGNLRTTTGVTTCGTVPANKKWHIIYLQLSYSPGASATAGEAQCLLNDAYAMHLYCTGTATQAMGQNAVAVFSYADCPTLIANQTIKLETVGVNGAGSLVYAYYEESV